MNNQAKGPNRARAARFVLIAAALTLGLIAARTAMAAGIVPSFGMSKPVDGDAGAKFYSGLAVRANIAPILKGEIGVAYRTESRFSDQLQVRSWPVTASLYLAPGPIYVGAGVGWYQTSFEYPSGSLLANETKQDFGVHAGGGVELPLTPAAGIDLNGRYVMLQDQQSRLVPEKFNPDFWTMSLGLALHF